MRHRQKRFVPIQRSTEYDHTIGLLEGMDIGSPTAQDCRVDGLDSKHPMGGTSRNTIIKTV